jgi:predicted signal transduction protein with EAL and GGDEF domain
MVARIGGDEFVVLLTGVESDDDASGLATRMIEAVSEPMHVQGHDITLGTSIGIQRVVEQSISAPEILRQADLALFRSKTEGRGCYRFHEPAMDAAREERRILEADMRQALERGEFIVHYQPIVNAQSGEMVGYEALVRWQHPKRGLVPPMSFIPLAEETGMINTIGEWVLKQACKDAMKLSDTMRMAVNLSPVQFRNPSLALHVVTALNESGPAPLGTRNH